MKLWETNACVGKHIRSNLPRKQYCCQRLDWIRKNTWILPSFGRKIQRGGLFRFFIKSKVLKSCHISSYKRTSLTSLQWTQKVETLWEGVQCDHCVRRSANLGLRKTVKRWSGVLCRYNWKSVGPYWEKKYWLQEVESCCTRWGRSNAQPRILGGCW